MPSAAFFVINLANVYHISQIIKTSVSISYLHFKIAGSLRNSATTVNLLFDTITHENEM